MAEHVTRRRLMTRTASALALTAAPVSANVSQKETGRQRSAPLTRIAFGSCAHQDKEQPIWDAVIEAKPDLFIFLGDNIYADTRDINVMRAKYAALAAKPGFKRLRENVPILAVWDDHDFGEDDAGAEYLFKLQSKQVFLEFWDEPAGSPRWSHDGIYTHQVFGPPGRRVQVILPDLRSNRTPIRKLDLGGKDYYAWAKDRHTAGQPVPGPYERNPDPTATMLGDAQWRWLEACFHEPADIRIFGSSLQVLPDFPGWECWINYARDHQRLIDLIRRTKCSGLVFLSGDTHYAEISKLEVNTPYPLWDITSSGITEVWPVLPPNDNRVGGAYRDVNFGVIDIQWEKPSPTLSLQIRDVNGEMRIEQQVSVASLKT